MNSIHKPGATGLGRALACALLGALMASSLGCSAMMRTRRMPRQHFWEAWKPEGPTAEMIYPDDSVPQSIPPPSVLSEGEEAFGIAAGGLPGAARGLKAGVAPDKAAAGFAFAREMDEFVVGRRARRAAPGQRGASQPTKPPMDTAPGGGAPEEARQPPAEKRLVIYTAQFAILVGNVDDAMKELLAKIESWEGYIQTADLKQVTFRVPAAHFDRAVEEISRMGVVTNKQIRAEDVTSQFRDLQLRLEVAETSRKRLLAILEKAQKAEDILKIENEIRRLTEEIESMKAQLRTLADQIAYSTITVELTAKAPQIRQMPRRRQSYFSWINQIGAEYVMRNF